MITLVNEEGAPWSIIHVIDGDPRRMGTLVGEWAWVGRIDDPDAQIAHSVEMRRTLARIGEMRRAG